MTAQATLSPMAATKLNLMASTTRSCSAQPPPQGSQAPQEFTSDGRSNGGSPSPTDVERSPAAGLSPFISACIVINYVNAGFVLLPSAFAHAGALLGTIILALVSLQSYVTSDFVLQTCARAEALHLLKGQQDDAPPPTAKTQSVVGGVVYGDYDAADDEEEIEFCDEEPPEFVDDDDGSSSPSEASFSSSQISASTPCAYATKDPEQAEGPLRWFLNWTPIPGDGVTTTTSGTNASAATTTQLHQDDEVVPLPAHAQQERRHRHEHVMIIKVGQERKFELSVLTKIFLGNYWSAFFQFTTMLDLAGITWALCSIFASTLASQAPLLSGPSSQDNYMLYVGIFMLITAPLSCTSILDQLSIQMVFLAARLVVVTLMIGTLVAAFLQPHQAHFGTQVGPASLSDTPSPLADFSQTIPMIQTAIFSTAFQFSIPTVAQSSRSQGRVLNRIFQAGAGFLFVANLIVALLVSSYFGPGATLPSSNLNWLHYHGGSAGGEDERSVWASAISYFVVLTAAIDGIAVYPLIALSLGDILMGAYFGIDKIHEMEQDWKVGCVFRLLASVPQAVGAMFVSDLGVIANYAGIFTLLSYTVCPAALYVKSQHRMEQAGLPVQTYYSVSSWSHFLYEWVPHLLVLVAGITMLGVIVHSILQGESLR